MFVYPLTFNTPKNTNSTFTRIATFTATPYHNITTHRRNGNGPRNQKKSQSCNRKYSLSNSQK